MSPPRGIRGPCNNDNDNPINYRTGKKRHFCLGKRCKCTCLGFRSLCGQWKNKNGKKRHLWTWDLSKPRPPPQQKQKRDDLSSTFSPVKRGRRGEKKRESETMIIKNKAGVTPPQSMSKSLFPPFLCFLARKIPLFLTDRAYRGWWWQHR